MRVLVAGGGTGGHLFPGLAIARALVRLEPAVQPFFIGAERGIERDVLPKTEFEHELLDLHPLYRKQPWKNVHTLTGALGSWGRVGRILRDVAPSVLLATGGYAAALAMAVARTRRIPIAIQEANSFPGLTVRLFSRWATEIYLGFPEAADRLRRGKKTRVIDTGNPIEPPVPLAARADRRTALRNWSFREDTKQVVLIVGGSQGARALNSVVAASLAALSEQGIAVIWSTGAGSFEQFRELNSDRTRVVPFISPIADAYSVADVAVSRAGAMTTAELCAWGIPSILVPLPTAAADHQTANADSLQKAGCAVLLRQTGLTADALVNTVTGLANDPDKRSAMQAAALSRARPTAAEDIARRILTISGVT